MIVPQSDRTLFLSRLSPKAEVQSLRREVLRVGERVIRERWRKRNPWSRLVLSRKYVLLNRMDSDLPNRLPFLVYLGRL